MGVYHAHIILYGSKYSYDEIPGEEEIGYEEYDEKIVARSWDKRSEGEPVLVTDGMSGDYALAGVLQYKSQKSRSGMPTIPLQKLEEPSGEQLFELADMMNDLDLDIDKDRGHYVLSHHF